MGFQYKGQPQFRLLCTVDKCVAGRYFALLHVHIPGLLAHLLGVVLYILSSLADMIYFALFYGNRNH